MNLNSQRVIKVQSTLAKPTEDVAPTPVVQSPTSNWAIAGAVLLASVPHLWKFLSGQQTAQSDLTKTLLQNLNESYQLSSTSNTAFRTMIESVAELPTELAQQNALALRDLLQEMADLRGQVIRLNQKIDNLATVIARQEQNR
jgi:hypothetical protein